MRWTWAGRSRRWICGCRGIRFFLAIVYAITGRTGDAAHLALMIAQVAVDLFSCVLIAALAAILALMVSEQAPARRVFVAGIWLAALCPFTANYTAVTLTEVFAIFFTAAALIPLCLMLGRPRNNGWLFIKREWWRANNYRYLAASAALLVGLCTLFRPESPLLLDRSVDCARGDFVHAARGESGGF